MLGLLHCPCRLYKYECCRQAVLLALLPLTLIPIASLQGVENLFDRQDRMASYSPTFCDVTWGAGGSTADLTLEIASKMQNMVTDGSSGTVCKLLASPVSC